MSEEDHSSDNLCDTSPSSPAAVELSELDSAKALAEKNKNDFLYLRAEFDNYRRNMIKERSDLLKYGSERLLVEILSILDNFERALEAKSTLASTDNLSNYIKGIEMTYQELKAVLTRFGVSEVPALGLPFDPLVHEALSSEETDEVKPGHVFRVFKKPYKLHDRIIRPAQVVVAKESTNN